MTRRRLLSTLTPQRAARLLVRAARNVGTLRALGDLPGHEFHGNQYTVGYHGTTESNVKGIESEGILPDGNDLSFLATDKESATEYAHRGVRQAKRKGLDVKPVVVEIHIPKSHALVPNFNEVGEYKIKGGIPKEWVKRVHRNLGQYETLAARESALHHAADAHVAKLSVAFRHAFAMGRRAIQPMLRAAGDVAGHEFHGNQWTTGDGSRDVEGANARLAELPEVNIRGYEGISTRQVFGSHVETPPFFVRGADGAYPVESIDTKGLIPTQDTADRDLVKKFIDKDLSAKADNEHLPKIVVLEDGRRFILDGHHRLAADALLGRQSRARVGRVVGGKLVQMRSASHAEDLASRASKAIEQALRKTLRPTLLACMKAGGEVALGGLRTAEEFRAAKRPPLKKKIGSINLTFDIKNARAAKWALEHVAWLIDSITQTTRERIQEAIARAQIGGDLDQQYQDILDAVGDEDRANVIARTESMTAANAGQREGWDQAVDAGLLPEDAKRQWIATGDESTCPICDALDGTEAALGEEYDGEDGGEGPPAHPSCRCTEGISLA